MTRSSLGERYRVLTYKRAKELFSYDPSTGIIKWASDGVRGRYGRRYRIGVVVGTLGDAGYLQVCVGNYHYLLHRLAWLLYYGRWPKAQRIDHINRVKTDNRICNLREATNSQNLAYGQGWKSKKGLPRGVILTKEGNFQARLWVNRKRIHLGTFKTIEEAVEAHKGASLRLRGGFSSYL